MKEEISCAGGPAEPIFGHSHLVYFSPSPQILHIAHLQGLRSPSPTYRPRIPCHFKPSNSSRKEPHSEGERIDRTLLRLGKVINVLLVIRDSA